MRLIAIEHEMPGVRAADFQPHLKAEARRAWDLYCAGNIREMYFTRDDHRAVLMLECNGEEEAEELLASLPLVQNGLIRFELLPLRPYDGFSRLFAKLSQEG